MAIAWLLLGPGVADAIKFGQNDAVELRGRFYSQVTLSTEYSQEYTQPPIDPGNLKQWRNFYNPELEVDFRRLTGWRGFFDDISGRLAIWGFYDGIYDFGPERYRENLAKTKNFGVEAAFYSEGYSVEQALNNTGRRRDGREFYGRRTRVNEAYLNLSKGPWFMRIGRQAISWGEADTIGLLDANNPFDVLLLPGLQMDLDEARIPLWTLRMTYELFSVLGPFSSGFLDAYWVPGWLDTETGYLNIQGVSPYSQPPPLQGRAIQVFDKLPRFETGNSRYGFKFQTVINRDYNLSVWFYRTFQTIPVPTLAGISQANPNGPGQFVTTLLHHGLTNVIGGALSWYSDTLNSIVRTELELFNNEPQFLAFKGIGSAIASGVQQPGTYETANVLRGELGVDHNFFIPEINPAASFLAVMSLVFQANLDESDTKDFRTPIIKPSAIDRELAGGPAAGQIAGQNCDNRNLDQAPGCDFVNQDPFEAFVQATVRSDFMGGRLTPQLTTIGTFRGALAFAPSVGYRLTDSFLFDFKYINVHTFGDGNNGYTPGVGLIRDRDQVWFRATYQLN
ncbi:MAG: DUF1302 family protein [Thermodesulfobacteriota bacterium]